MSTHEPGYRFPRGVSQTGILSYDGDTPAYQRFVAVDTEIQALLATTFDPVTVHDNPESPDHAWREARRAEQRQRNRQINDQFSGPWAVDIEAVMLRWQVVMNATAVEVYLQDAMAHLALYWPELLRGKNVKQE